ncbi:MAG: hypothetical protein SH809_13725, partial [Rhodothermales bacterium]|nr:hypothetical protein [Rhodothermales bacterium]
MRTLHAFPLILLLTLPAAAQNARILADDEACVNQGWGDRERYCEVREITLPADRSVIDIDGGQNGGIRVEGWDRDEILVRAIVSATARTEDAAREHVGEVTIDTDGTIRADIPKRTGRGNDWTSVSFELFVPHASNLAIETHNGGIHIAEIEGDIRFEALNGGVKLIDLAGDVRGETTNGGVEIELAGSEWEGESLDV